MDKSTKAEDIISKTILRHATLLACLHTTDENIHIYATLTRAQHWAHHPGEADTSQKLSSALREYRRLVHAWRRLYRDDPPGFRSPTWIRVC